MEHCTLLESIKEENSHLIQWDTDRSVPPQLEDFADFSQFENTFSYDM